MQLKFGRDFLMRTARASDLKEVVALVLANHKTEISEQISRDFLSYIGREDLLFQVILNSNGVLIGTLLLEPTQIVTIAINPNFLRKEVRDEVTNRLKTWALEQNAGKLLVPRELSANDWKAYWKRNGLQVDEHGAGTELIQFI